MSPTDTANGTAYCPKCRTPMVHVAMTPHPVVRTMQRNTFVCYSCRQTRTYMLPGKPELKALESEVAQSA
jgi:hypothetical protein